MNDREDQDREPEDTDRAEGGDGGGDGDRDGDGDDVKEGFVADMLRQATITGEPGNTAGTSADEPPAATAMPAASDDDT
ncbi:hypothetical protein WEH80_01550 [Actinomycetes bacterium KLBMP 9759]